ncbi:RNA-binding protein Msa1 [Schizosaccharomyces pombe]|uniref:Multicopy suppressor of sporulation protein msa1 n=1 Tax=Schizosaccharomyces pombe (strain 972 / ATCC 24843) TaxID=284812 RepID=MSA1_SCHPO|nr:RNA-binding protein Msa1 [Schizosaccharomyces pombe]Q10277.1 RecName: Full=Multicopy suppressor of sporulation protein msa1 [Schizosaccharomyces pombe 972h-]CAA93601.2 RNA-binding protein Msa1 [Schizosaccharomyces pombe]|eukprot:NP_593715.2 RNA-binding protein Msa1 [Schizosaccharomyces pombe]
MVVSSPSVSLLHSPVEKLSAQLEKTTLLQDIPPGSLSENDNSTTFIKPPLETASSSTPIPSSSSSGVLNPSSVRGKPVACLFVASLNSSRSEEELTATVKDYFQQWGPLLHVKVLKDWLQRPYSFVQFQNTDDASKALSEAQNTILDGRHIRIERAKVNRTIRISSAPHQPYITKKDIDNLLEPYGEVEDVTEIPDQSAFLVRFVYRDEAIAAYTALKHSAWPVLWAENVTYQNGHYKKKGSSPFSPPNAHSRRRKSQGKDQSNTPVIKAPAPIPFSVSSDPPSTMGRSNSAVQSPSYFAHSLVNSTEFSTPNESLSSLPSILPSIPSLESGKAELPTDGSFEQPGYPMNPSMMFAAMPPPIDPYSIFVGQLDPVNCTHYLLVDLFSKYGKVIDCKIIHQSKKPAFAFLRFDSQQAAYAAVCGKTRSPHQKKPLRVEFRQLRPMQQFSPQYQYPSYPYPMFPAPFSPPRNAMMPIPAPMDQFSTFHQSMATLPPGAVPTSIPQSYYPIYSPEMAMPQSYSPMYYTHNPPMDGN